MMRGWFPCFCLTALAIPGSLYAQDRRTVREPALPRQVCATLAPTSGDATRRLQSAINACPAGSAVRLVAGADQARFVSGPLVMKSGVTLWLDRDAVLAASADPHAHDNGGGRCGTIDSSGKGCRPFLLFQHTNGGGIVGEGLIDGQGGHAMAGRTQSWWQLARRAQQEGGDQNIPRLIQVIGARNIVFYRVTLHDAPNFHVALTDVDGATFWGIRIDTPADARNTDGIDPGGSQDVTIAHSYIRAGDDNIAIKAGRGSPSRYISVVHTHFYWGHGMSIGSETIGGVSDILVRDVTLDGTTSGLRIKSDASRGGLVHQVRFEDICLRNNRMPIDFDTRYDSAAQGMAIPIYRDILLHDVTGGDGDLIVQGYDAAHPLALTLDGVRFGAASHWQVNFATITVGPGGVSPRPPGLSGPDATGARPDCDRRWVPFPTEHDRQNAADAD
ncbi:glycoside hydrolase family 28 protein [Sphingomonas sp. ASY06-1R]|uniref:glycoside hydrolase family 28 protein n=1 Tax=Sphingomonas sp. ASY06-1R TaxID=3445771 RepID=UPI003FA33C9C